MADEYLEASQRDAKEISKTLQHLDVLLASEKLDRVYGIDATELRRNLRKMLISINTDLENLSNLEKDDIFKTNPVHADRRYQLMKNIETAKVDFEFEIMPSLDKVTRQVVEKSKQIPPQVDESVLPPAPHGERWTVQKVLDMADQFLEQSTRAGTIVAKAFTLAKALGVVLGIPVP